MEAVGDIRIGAHTQEDVRSMFGPPWRTGLEDGTPTWTYAHYRRGLTGDTRTRDLVIRFDTAGTVRSYSFNSTYPEDAAVRAQPPPL